MAELSKKAIRILRTVEKRILAEPRRFDMRQWGRLFDPKNRKARAAVVESFGELPVPGISEAPPCGSVGCIAGQIYLAVTPKKQLRKRLLHEMDYGSLWYSLPPDSQSIAREQLGIPRDSANRLFFLSSHTGGSRMDHWPMAFESAYVQAKTDRQRAKVAVARIEHFISTDGAE